MQEEIGRGAFSVVHRCTHRVTGEDFAVKIIDLRPLKLRETFDQSRLRRRGIIMMMMIIIIVLVIIISTIIITIKTILIIVIMIIIILIPIPLLFGREVEIMQQLSHPNIIRLEAVFETPTTLMLVLEYAPGTELFDSILQVRWAVRYSEHSNDLVLHTSLTYR
jgi:serine/threonine protein kinase